MLKHILNCLLICFSCLVILGGTAHAQYETIDLFQFSREWQDAANETNMRHNLNPDFDINEMDLLRFIEGWRQNQTSSNSGPSEIEIEIPGMPQDAKPLTMIRIPAGSFVMGSTDDMEWSWCAWDREDKVDCEQPRHIVNIGYDFYIGKYEVTQAQWEAIIGSNPAEDTIGNDYPVTYVTWYDCNQFINQLNQLQLGQFRFPSEAEWEYACRAGSTTRFHFGDSTCPPTEAADCDLNQYEWWAGNNDPRGLKEVGLLLPNDFGLHDMHGNVTEYCQDFWHDNYLNAPTDGSAWLDNRSWQHVVRGNRWDAWAKHQRSSRRNWTLAMERYDGVGLRLVMEVPSE